jgi:hypothetical protein
MSGSLTLFLPLDVKNLEALLAAYQEDFEDYLSELFSEVELEAFEEKLDAIAAVFAQPMLDVAFDDFSPDPVAAEEQRAFFAHCRSTLVFENLPYLETNAFQVAYLTDLVRKFDEALIDRGGTNDLLFRERFLETLKPYKSIDTFVAKPKPVTPKIPISSAPVDPIDFLLRDVYGELDRLGPGGPAGEELSPKARKIFDAVRTERTTPDELLRRAGLNAKDLDDGLESLKFWLRRH